MNDPRPRLVPKRVLAIFRSRHLPAVAAVWTTTDVNAFMRALVRERASAFLGFVRVQGRS